METATVLMGCIAVCVAFLAYERMLMSKDVELKALNRSLSEETTYQDADPSGLGESIVAELVSKDVVDEGEDSVVDDVDPLDFYETAG